MVRFLDEFCLRHADSRPEKPAIVSASESVTYAELVARVETLAKQVERLGLGAGDRALIVSHPTVDAIALELALSQLGVAFGPVSPETPHSRIAELVESVHPELIVETGGVGSYVKQVLGHEPAWAVVQKGSLELRTASAAETVREPRRQKRLATDPAYIIFTSGTTGSPKGIVMSHGASLSALGGACGMMDDRDARVGSISPLQFDFSLLDMGLALGTGATLVLVPRLLALHPKGFVDFLVEHQVTQMDCVPSIWRAILRSDRSLVRELSQLRTLLYGGEGFAPQEIRDLQELMPNVRIMQAFGHSESILCTFGEVPRGFCDQRDRASIGYSFPEMEVFLINEEGACVRSPGKLGEMYIRGPALFSGYWNKPDLTAERLIPDPRYPESQERVFRTGDLAFWGEAGELYFWGRGDTQVKVAGNRVELEEIEATLKTHALVVDAVAVLENKGDRERILAFIVGDEREFGAARLQELRSTCAARLPRYAVPHEFVFTDVMPVTANGKVDRSALLAEMLARAVR